MFSKLARNAILVGQLNSYCLVCACHFDTEGGAHDHVLESKHISNLRGARYCETLRKDYIRQVKDGYFCGMCNTLLPTSTHVKLHVLKATHAENRGTLLLDRASSSNADGVLAFGCFQVSDDAWHGLIDETCVICNAEFEDKDTHKKEPTHLLKLVQSKVLFGDEASVYRKIDEGLYQCLTCNIVVCATSFNDHFYSTDHQAAYEQCEITDDDSINKVSDSTDTDETIQSKGEVDEAINIEKKAGEAIKIEKKADEAIKSEEEADETIKTRKDTEEATGSAKKKVEPILIKSESQEKVSTTVDESPILDSLPTFRGLTNINCDLHCTTCELTFPGCFFNIQQHVNGKRHKDKTSQLVVKKASDGHIIKQQFNKFTKDIRIFGEDNFDKNYIINESVCLPFLSLMFIGHSFYGMFCIACHTQLPCPPLVDEHVNCPNHLRIVEECHVITSLESEFVREVRRDEYHCGFCNKAFNGWNDLQHHLILSAHKRNKEEANQRLRKHMHVVRTNEMILYMYFCEICGYATNNEDEMHAHNKSREHRITKIRGAKRDRGIKAKWDALSN